MKIGEVSRETGLSASRIRFYERTGLIAPAERGVNGYRDYSPAIVPLLRFIELAQTLGFTLREIADAAPTVGEHAIRCDDAIVLLKNKLTAVDALIAGAETRRRQIVGLITELGDRRVNAA